MELILLSKYIYFIVENQTLALESWNIDMIFPFNLTFLMCKVLNKKKSVTTCYVYTLKMKSLLGNIPSLLIMYI